MFHLLVILILIIAVLVILAVLVQNSKKEGLGNAWSDTGTSQLMGVQKTGDFLENLTWGMVMTIFVLTLFTSRFPPKAKEGRNNHASPNIERAQRYAPLTSAEQPAEKETPVPQEDP